jgi:excisionase family DNA binding protein
MIEAISNALADRVATKIGMAQTPLMGVDQLAVHLGVPKGWIYDRTRISEEMGGIPHFKIGKYVRFDLEAVLSWLKATVKLNGS